MEMPRFFASPWFGAAGFVVKVWGTALWQKFGERWL